MLQALTKHDGSTLPISASFPAGPRHLLSLWRMVGWTGDGRAKMIELKDQTALANIGRRLMSPLIAPCSFLTTLVSCIVRRTCMWCSTSIRCRSFQVQKLWTVKCLSKEATCALQLLVSTKGFSQATLFAECLPLIMRCIGGYGA